MHGGQGGQHLRGALFRGFRAAASASSAAASTSVQRQGAPTPQADPSGAASERETAAAATATATAGGGLVPLRLWRRERVGREPTHAVPVEAEFSEASQRSVEQRIEASDLVAVGGPAEREGHTFKETMEKAQLRERSLLVTLGHSPSQTLTYKCT